MGFFGCDHSPSADSINGVPLAQIHKHQCAICPLNPQTGISREAPLLHPYMAATGAAKPLVYMLGEAPGEDEDREGRQFVGRSGQLLRWRAPYLEAWEPYLRWNNVVRTRPPDNRDPTDFEVECCRPSITADIEAAQPEAIFGFGNVPLNWAFPAIGANAGIMKWRGRRLPVRVGAHACWFFPLLHPSGIARKRRFEPLRLDQYPSEDEFAFAEDLERAFRAVERGLPPPVAVTPAAMLSGVDYVTGNHPGHLQRVLDFIDSCRAEPLVGIDYETNRLRPYMDGAKILTVALAGDEKALAWPLWHPEAGWTAAQREVIEDRMKGFLHDAPCAKISFSLPFEMEWSAYWYGRECLRSGRWEDAQSQAYVLDERRDTMSLDFHMLEHFGLAFKAISGNIDRNRLEFTPLPEVLRYNALDALAHRMLFIAQERRIEQEGLGSLYDHQLRRAPAMVATQLAGTPVDQGVVEDFIAKYEGRRDAALDAMFAIPEIAAFRDKKGRDFNPGSTQHVQMLIARLGFVGVNATDEAELAALDHPAAAAVVAWRKPTKALSTYLYPCRYDYEDSVVMEDGLIHPNYNICKVVTWRTSASDPNIQNFYKRDPDLAEIRAVVRGPDLKVVAFDYAGIQARNVAMESKDPRLVAAFRNRYDIHSDWRERIARRCPYWMGKGADAKAFRHLAKNRFVFPSFFGARPAKLAAGLGIDERDAEDMLAEFWDEFPAVIGWHNAQIAFYRDHGYVTGCSGWRRRAPCSPNELINAPIQGDEALIVVTAMCELSELEDPRYQPAMEIHDDLTFLWPKADIERNAEVVIGRMLDTPYEWAHIVPIEVEMSVGDDWHALKPAGAYASDTWSGRVTLDKPQPVDAAGPVATQRDDRPQRQADRSHPEAVRDRS